MARLPYPDPATASPEAREALAQLASPLNIMSMVSHADTLIGPVIELAAAMFTAMDVDPAARELAILRVARLSNADYEWVQHEPLALRLGVPADHLKALWEGDLSCFGERERRAIEVADWVCLGGTVTEDQIDALREAFTSKEILELFMVTGCYLLLARIMTSLDIEIDPADGKLMKAQVSASV